MKINAGRLSGVIAAVAALGGCTETAGVTRDQTETAENREVCKVESPVDSRVQVEVCRPVEEAGSDTRRDVRIAEREHDLLAVIERADLAAAHEAGDHAQPDLRRHRSHHETASEQGELGTERRRRRSIARG